MLTTTVISAIPTLLQLIFQGKRLRKSESRSPNFPPISAGGYIDELGLPEKDAQLLTKYRKISEYFDEACKGVKSAKTVANFIIGQMFSRTETEADKEIFDVAVTPAQLNELVKLMTAEKSATILLNQLLKKCLTRARARLIYQRKRYGRS